MPEDPVRLQAPDLLYHSLQNDIVDPLQPDLVELLETKDLLVLQALLSHAVSNVQHEMFRRRGPVPYPQPF